MNDFQIQYPSASSSRYSNFTQLTLICLTYERHDFVRRQIAYFSASNVSLIFADGSSSALFDSELKKVKYGSCSVSYFNIPGASTYLKRIQQSLSLTETDYVMFIDDADLYFLSGIELALNSFLLNPNSLFAAGYVCQASKLASGCLKYFDWGHWSKPFALLNQDPAKRLVELITNMRTGNMYYGVMPKTMLLKSVQLSSQIYWSCNAGNELMHAGLLAISNSYEMGHYPFWTRTDEPSIPAKKYSSLSASEWHSSLSLDRLYLINCLVVELILQSKCSVFEAFTQVVNFMDIHHKQSMSPYRLNVKQFLVEILPFLPALKHYLLKFFKWFHVFSFFGAYPVIPIDNLSFPSLLEYWTSRFPNLDEFQLDDIKRYDLLMREFPAGMNSCDFDTFFK